MNKNVANNVANEKVQDLTEQWKNGELEGEYYIETNDGKHYVCELQTRSGVKNKRLPLAKSFNGYVSNKSVAEVLAPVPSYEEWIRTNYSLDDYKRLSNMREEIISKMEESNEDTVKYLREENAKLKELLKECRNWLKSYRDTHISIKDDLNETICKIDEVLK